MKYLDYSSNDSPDIVNSKFESYRTYLQENRELFPGGAYEFASAEWHYNSNDPKCPHDSWVKCLSIVEEDQSEKEKGRSIDIKVELLGAYHDGTIHLTYERVISYGLHRGSGSMRGPQTQGHGDWLIDEIRLAPESKGVIHEIKFWLDATWTIECSDIRYEWIPS